MDMRNFIRLVEDASEGAAPQNLLVIVHPGSACGSGDFNLGRENAKAQRDDLTRSIAAWNDGGVIVLSGSFDSEMKQPRYATLGNAITSALARAKGAKRIAIKKRAPDPSQVTVIQKIMAELKLPPETRIEVTGAWTGHEEKGCVDSVVEALHSMGYTKAFISDDAVHIDEPVDESFDDSRLLEMPQLGADEDFSLGDEDINRVEYRRIMSYDHNVIKQNGNLIFGQFEYGSEGELFFVDTQVKQVYYTVQYDVFQTKTFGQTVIQKVLWKKPGTAQGIPVQGFWYLLDQYGTLMTDKGQTDAGRAFWIKRIHEAKAKGLTIAMFDGRRTAVYDGASDLDAWIDEQDAWGEHHSYGEVAFVISKKRI